MKTVALGVPTHPHGALTRTVPILLLKAAWTTVMDSSPVNDGDDPFIDYSR